jgi:hypothetical protein
MYSKLAFRVYLICSGIVILAGFIMILRQETTFATIQSKTSTYRGNYTGWQMLIVGAMMALTGWGAWREIKKKKRK